MASAKQHSPLQYTRLRCAMALTLAALFCLGHSAGAQQVRPGQLNGYGSDLRAFSVAAARQARADWYGSPFTHPGTAVQVTFGARNADITLITPISFGMGHLLDLSKSLTGRLEYPNAAYLLRTGKRTVSVDIDLSRYVRRDRYRSSFRLDLSRLAAGLNALPLVQPVMIGVSPRTVSEAVITTPLSHHRIRNIWFVSPSPMPEGTAIEIRSEVSPTAGVTLAGIVLMLICMPIVVFRMVGSLEMHFASLQSSAEAGASAVTVRLPKNFAMLAYLTVMTCILAPALVIALVTSPATRIALNLLLANADATVKALAVAYMAIILAVNSLSSRHISSKRPGWMVRAILRLLLHMGFSVTLPVCIMGGLLTVPVYMPSQLVALRIVDLVIFGTIPIGIFCAIRQFVRCFQTPVTQGALFEMVQEVAAQAGVRVRSVCLFTAGTSTLYATAFRSLWISPRLADTLLPDEMRALLAHAIGRLKYGHPQRILAAFVAANLLYGAVLAALIVCLPEGITSLPSRSPGDPFSCLLIVNLLVTVWVTMGHRKRESQAEEFAVEVTNDADLVINALNRQQELAWSRAAKRDAAK